MQAGCRPGVAAVSAHLPPNYHAGDGGVWGGGAGQDHIFRQAALQDQPPDVPQPQVCVCGGHVLCEGLGVWSDGEAGRGKITFLGKLHYRISHLMYLNHRCVDTVCGEEE
jgi:hypothetical protein